MPVDKLLREGYIKLTDKTILMFEEVTRLKEEEGLTTEQAIKQVFGAAMMEDEKDTSP